MIEDVDRKSNGRTRANENKEWTPRRLTGHSIDAHKNNSQDARERQTKNGKIFHKGCLKSFEHNVS